MTSRKTTIRKPLLRMLAGERTGRVPFWFMRQAGRYLPEYQALRRRKGGFLEMCRDPAAAAEVTLQPLARFGMDAAILFSDILVIPEALGQGLAFHEGEGPVLDAIGPEDGLLGLSADGLEGRLGPVYEALDRVAGAVPAEVTVLGFAGAPWTLATYMVEGGSSRDFLATKSWAWGDPEGFGRLIELLTGAVTRHLVAQIRAGAEAVQIFDTWAGALPERAFEAWSLAPLGRIVRDLHAACPGTPVIVFPRGAGALWGRVAAVTGADAVSIDTQTPPGFAAREVQPRAAVQGNLDPVMLVAGGEAMLDEARYILEALSGGPHVFNLGHGILPQTPPDHVAALSALLRGETG